MEPFLALEVDSQPAVPQAASFLDDHHDLVFTTASEEVKPTSAAARAPPRRPVETDSDSDSYSSEEGAADLLGQLKGLRKSWQGRATPDDESSSDDDKAGLLKAKSEKKTKKFVLLEGKRAKSKSRGRREEKLLQKLAGSSDGNPWQALATVELLKKFRGKTKKKHNGSSSSSASARGSRVKFVGQPPGTQGHRSSQGSQQLSKLEKRTQETPSETRTSVRQAGGARLGSHGWSTIQAHRSRQAHCLESAEVTPAGVLPLGCHPRQATSGASRSGRDADGAIATCGASSGDRRGQLVCRVAPNRSGGPFCPTKVRRRRRVAGDHSGFPEGFARPGEANEVLELGRRQRAAPASGDCRGDTKGKGPKGSKGRGRSQDPAKADASGMPQVSDGDIDSLLALLNKHHGSFSRFFKCYSSTRDRLEERAVSSPHTGDCMFPSLLQLGGLGSLSRKGQWRQRRKGRGVTRQAMLWCQVLWAYLNFLEAGCPATQCKVQAWCRRAALQPWTTTHASHASLLFRAVLEFCSLEVAEAPGRGIKKALELVERISSKGYHNLGACEWDDLQQCAQYVKPDRMSLPDAAGIVDPADFLKGEHREQFLNMSRDVPIQRTPASSRKPCHRVKSHDIVEVYTKLLDSGVAVLLPEEEALYDSKGCLISGGLFGVPHKAHSDRIINDRRPFNQSERRLVWAKLPHGTLLTQLVLSKELSVRASGDDLRNFFYLLKHREEWLPRNVVGSSVSGKFFEKHGADASRRYVLAFRVVCMGDVNAVDICQQTHIEILRDAGLMRPEHVLEYDSPLPLEHTLEGLYIDDHVVIQIGPKKRYRRQVVKAEFSLDEELISRSRQQYKDLKLPVSQDKAFTKSSKFKVWGTEVDSATGRVGTPCTSCDSCVR